MGVWIWASPSRWGGSRSKENLHLLRLDNIDDAAQDPGMDESIAQDQVLETRTGTEDHRNDEKAEKKTENQTTTGLFIGTAREPALPEGVDPTQP